MEEEIKKLEAELEYEERYYNVAVEYPTKTPQFYDALQRQADKIRNLRQEIIKLQKENECVVCGRLGHKSCDNYPI